MRRLSAARVHLQVRVALQNVLHRHERAPITERETIFGAAVVAPAPAVSDEGQELFRRGATTQRPAEIQPLRGVQAEVPHAVGR